MQISNMILNSAGYQETGLLFTDLNFSISLGTGAAVALTIPGNSAMGTFGGNGPNRFIAVIKYGNGAETLPIVWVSENGVASPPGGGAFGATTSQLNPEAREVKEGDLISFYTDDTGVEIGVSLYAVQK